MGRDLLISWYETTKGQILQQEEADFLSRSITVSCKQIIVQIGALGWENCFIDCTFYKHFIIADPCGSGLNEAQKVSTHLAQLPFMCDSVDMVILPHTLEFSDNQHQVLREVERILKPEGKLIVLNFNPWSYSFRYHYAKHRDRQEPRLGRFITHARIVDWLKLLNFEVEIAAGFNFKTLTSSSTPCTEKIKFSIWDAAYAVKAIKRRYNVIPLTPVRYKSSRLAIAGGIEPAKRLGKS